MLPVWRHRLLVVRPDVWRGICADMQIDLDDAHTRDIVLDWADKGWPLICRRPYESELAEINAGGVALGLPLPPAMGKKRLGFVIPSYALSFFSGDSWPCNDISRPGLTSARLNDISLLGELGAQHGVAPEAAGSLLWETLTGLPYLSETSDFDVMWRLPASKLEDQEDLSAFLSDLDRTARKLSVRLDGEVIFPDGRAVQWQELHSARPDDEVLVKNLTSVELVPVRTLAGLWGRLPA
ncbi:MAG: malonate decarboxylase holo-[acyl-carrier-protein] synthase [Acetobacter sp.]|nr:malonate decarboxylase holo-[acyl-carrier-protein] synthase [Acetobacter sp.]MCI1319706.1 malonate decarboxylase holo-[acyl-carrier-protein] synthase [Acetobacter sp.]MCI1372740.1 malonate decarboxylase holo-[acyl-carrier-protein] synthase [Acetobacter sp.]MCI1413020.1 malonate decarboxylase holo-[acyl-carrier-protein] synthase [Acetobacter sp.]MCI1441169.1 malonate decarboxylase holo-[acyl-carrier-protein] synthase [Acetobacter sp.]